MDEQDMNILNTPEEAGEQGAATMPEDEVVESPAKTDDGSLSLLTEQEPVHLDTEDLESDIRYQTVSVPYPPKQQKKGGAGKWIIILGAALLLTIAYSVIQTVYIYKLNTGSEGIKSYIAGLTDKKGQETAAPSDKPEDMSDKKNYEPWFSLEEATADYKDMSRLSTVEIAKKLTPSTVSIEIMEPVNGKDTATSAGSGFIITKDGYIVTNAHVVEDVTSPEMSIKVKIPAFKDMFDAKIIGMDEQTDVAVIKIESGEDLPVAELGNSDLLEPGELVVVIGNALGTLDGTVTAGVISALDRQIRNGGYTIPVIQTDAAINSGNSGGPMINSYGQVIGITNAKMVSGTAEGLGFGIPINKVKTVIESIINYGKVINRPFLGMTLSRIEEGAYYGVEPGVYVVDMIQDGPAVKSGLEVGDQVLSFDGVEISSPSDIIGIRDSHNVGDNIDVVIIRDGKKQTIVFTIGDSGDYEGSSSLSDLPGNDGNPFNNGGSEPTRPTDRPDGSAPSDGDSPRGLDIFGQE
ncbi:MAG: trypsin-like peptidase domain-containing protein [Clostridiales bacterium]|nr:trypsin-like peptidase domain-containing protein [Clostridiales bacterium]